ncbi:MAG: hypothetical protein K8E66_06255, partial [Phycisphaerales bacterium]|nr:hypothetical protein [Phycisphaerales bacterium]
RDIEPNAARHAVRLAEALRSANEVIETRAESLIADSDQDGDASFFSRIMLRNQERAVLLELIVQLHHSKTGGQRRDRINQRSLTTCIGAIYADSGEERLFDLGGLRIVIDSGCVSFS